MPSAIPGTSRRRMLGAGAVLVLAGVAAWPAAAADKSPVPDFARQANTGWVLDRTRDDLLPPESGPGPITFDPAHPYIANFQGPRPTYRVADLTNPILQPWVIQQMKRANDEVLAGKIPFRARERCWPIGVPGFVIYSLVEPVFFLQTPGVVTMISQGGPEIRRVYLDVPHSANPKPTWNGESIGHYENGDTLVVDTIGLSDRTFIDNYRTPHTTQLHVVERFKQIRNGEGVQIDIAVDDPGAFTTPWKARQRWRRVEGEPLVENRCDENNGDFFGQNLFPTPIADKPDF